MRQALLPMTLLPLHGGYRNLRSFQLAQAIYDPKPNRASLGELLLDYEDFLRQKGLRLWPKDSPEAMNK